MKFFTADHHFYHERIIHLSRRPFTSLEDMHNTMIANWNRKVKKNDLVYIIGDFCFRHSGEILEKLSGQKIFLPGSHDRDTMKAKYRHHFLRVEPLIMIKEEGQTVVMCHWPMFTWHKSNPRLGKASAWHLHGHHHGDLEPYGKMWDVGVDNNNFEPVSWEEIKKIMYCLPANRRHHALKYGPLALIKKLMKRRQREKLFQGIACLSAKQDPRD